MNVHVANPFTFQQPAGQVAPMSRNNLLDGAALSLVIVYLFIILSRILDFAFSLLHIPMFVLILLTVIALASGALFRGLNSQLGIWLAIWAVWMGVTVPFSQWKGGSTAVYLSVLQPVVLALCIIGTSQTIKDSSRLMRTVALAGLIAALLSFAFGQSDNGRLVLGSGTFLDPNIYAMFLVMTVPIWLWMAARASTKPRKCAMYLALAPILWAILRTGSRGGAIGLLAVFVSVLLSVSLGRKVGILAVMAALLVVASLTLPDYIRLRYFTLFQPDSTENLSQQEQESLSGDAGSAAGRETLLLDSLKITLSYPIFGVGLDEFSQTNWSIHREKRGNGPGAMVTHNTYTQVSSETGIPGLIILLALFTQCLRTVNSTIRQSRPPQGYRPDIVEMGIHLRHTFVAVAVCAFFLSVAYGPLIYVIVGLFGAFFCAVQNELRAGVPAILSGPAGPAMMPGVKPSRFQPGYVSNYRGETR
jgi:O-antigen ligase